MPPSLPGRLHSRFFSRPVLFGCLVGFACVARGDLPPSSSPTNSAVVNVPATNRATVDIKRPDRVAEVLARSVTEYEQMLNDTNLSPSLRLVYGRLLDFNKKMLAERQAGIASSTNVPRAMTPEERVMLLESMRQPHSGLTLSNVPSLPAPGWLPPSRLSAIPHRTLPAPATNETFPGNVSYTNLAEMERHRLDFMAKSAAGSLATYEWMLADTNLDPASRATYEMLLANGRRQAADRLTNALLWENVHEAEGAHDQKKLSEARQQLANYLAARLGSIRGKAYPTGMDLDAVIVEYRKVIATNNIKR